MSIRFLKKPLLVLFILSIIITLVLGFSNRIVCTRYTIDSDKITGRVKIVVVADFHGCRYGEHSEPILKIILEENPDVVLLCGDIYDDELPFDKSNDLVGQLSEAWPVYYVSGNHEYWSGQIDSIKAMLTRYGVRVLEGTGEEVHIGKDTIFIGGIDDPTYLGMEAVKSQANSILFPSNHYSVLLSHRPELTELFSAIPVDLVISGHAHGGQVRIPYLLNSGLFAPDQGFFPKYTTGIHELNSRTSLLISRGLAKESTRVPRFFNNPEILSVTLTSGAGTEDGE